MTTSQKDEPVIIARELTRLFRDFWLRTKVAAVRGSSFEIHKGEIFGLLGPNGSGKSTTLKMILGLLRPTSGTLTVLGGAPDNVRNKARIGFLPEESCLYPYLTATETLTFYARLFDIPATIRRQRVEELLAMTGLTQASHRLVREFSKGMARRIGLAQALINDPELIILDEPTSGLDPIACRQVKDLLLALAARGKTILVTSHLLADIEDICDRVAIMYNGRIEALGPVADLLEQKQRLRLTLPDGISSETQARVLALIHETLGTPPEVDHPSRDLESYFLSVVEQARSGQAPASGADSNRSIANYLKGS